MLVYYTVTLDYLNLRPLVVATSESYIHRHDGDAQRPPSPRSAQHTYQNRNNYRLAPVFQVPIDLIHAAITRDRLLRLCTANVCWRSAHVAEPVEVSVGEADGEPEVDGLLVDPVFEDEPDVDVPEAKDTTGGPGKVY